MKRLPAGTELELEEGLITRIWDPNRHLWLEAHGEAGQLKEAHFRLLDGSRATLRTGHGSDPVLGEVDAFFLPEESEPFALVGSVDWSKPAYIPAVDKPARMPAGLGAAVLNYLSLHALLNGTESLRYRGPYATGKLFDSLFRSFHLGDQEPTQAWKTFNHRVEVNALNAEVVSPAVDFYPAPFEWLQHSPSVCAELRGSLERLVIEGRSYGRDPQSSRQILEVDGGYQAVIRLADVTWCKRLDTDAQGVPLGSLNPIPALDTPMMGRVLEPRLLQVLSNALVHRAPEMLAPALELVLAKVPVEWGHAGDETCTFDGTKFILHAGLSNGLANQPPDKVLTALVYALEPATLGVATRVFQTQQNRNADSAL